MTIHEFGVVGWLLKGTLRRVQVKQNRILLSFVNNGSVSLIENTATILKINEGGGALDMGRLSSYTQQLHSISVNHSPNPNPTNLNPNLKSAECTRLLFFRNAGCKNATHETV